MPSRFRTASSPRCGRGWASSRCDVHSSSARTGGHWPATGESCSSALATFAEAYADQNERDYAALKNAVDLGRVAAELSL